MAFDTDLLEVVVQWERQILRDNSFGNQQPVEIMEVDEIACLPLKNFIMTVMCFPAIGTEKH